MQYKHNNIYGCKSGKVYCKDCAFYNLLNRLPHNDTCNFDYVNNGNINKIFRNNNRNCDRYIKSKNIFNLWGLLK